MNIANKITLVRIFLVPVFLLFMLTDFTAYNSIIAFVVFVIATLTDKIDGTIARKYNLVTDFLFALHLSALLQTALSPPGLQL